MADSTIVRAHQHSASAKGSSKKLNASGGQREDRAPKSTPPATPGQACDLDGADALLGEMVAEIPLDDKGYDADARVLDWLAAAEIEPVIPPKFNRKLPRDYDKALYNARQLIEYFFEKLEHYSSIAKRYDKSATAFLAATVVWLN